MPSRLPPLVWLRSFEAAGRHRSFKRAAEELHVTPSTISHQVRDLEDWLQTPLFERITRAVKLTEAGEQYLQTVSTAFQNLSTATDKLKPSTQPVRLKIGMFPSFASEIVVPRIAELQAMLPEVELTIDSNTRLEALMSEDESQRCDALVRYGKGDFPGCIARLLTEIRIAPMCAPAYLKQHQLTHPEDLDKVTLIKLSGPFDGWRYWAQQVGVEIPNGRDRLVLDNYLSAMRAVKQGLGVGIGILPLNQSWLDKGQLRIALEPLVKTEESSWLVYTRRNEGNPLIETLFSWLQECLAEHPAMDELFATLYL